MGKIGDLWVKLGLKKDDFSKGLSEAKKETTAFKALTSAAVGGAVMIWQKIGKAAVEAAIQFAHSSQRFGDVWDNTMSKMQSAWGTFLSSLTSWDWDNFGRKMKNAMDAAGYAQELKDQYGDLDRSIRLRKAAMREELSLLEVQMRNQQLSNSERAKAAQEYLNLVKPLYEEEANMRKKIMIADMNQWLEEAGVRGQESHRKDLVDFFTNIAPNPEAVKAMSEGYGTMAKIAQHYLATSDEVSNAVINTFEAYTQATAAFNEENRRVMQSLNSSIARDADKGIENITEKTEEVFDSIEQFRIATGVLKDIEHEFENTIRSIDDPDIDLGDDSALEKFVEDYEDMVEKAKAITQEFREAVVSGFSEGLEEMFSGLMGAEKFNGGAAVAALLTPLADLATKEGEILMASGMGLEALQKALMNPMTGGVAAIGAGAALIAIGAAAKAGLSALAQKGSASTGVASTYTGSGASETGKITTELTVYVEGRISGSDIVMAGQRTMNQWAR